MAGWHAGQARAVRRGRGRFRLDGRVAQPESAKVNTDEVLVETSGDFSDSKILEGLEETTQPASATECSGANGLSSSGDTAEVRDFPLLFENDNPQ